MPTVLITGANRGIGLEFARQYAADGWRVHAACRNPDAATALKAIKGEVHLHRLDVTDLPQIAAVAKSMAGEAIDVLINNAGVGGPREAFGHTESRAWLDTFRVNALGPVHVAEQFVEHVARSERKLIVSITSLMGSIADNTGGGHYAYRTSKAALNMAVKSLSVDLRSRGITAVVVNPGWVKTDMGGPGARLTPAESVTGMRSKIAALSLEDTGKFFNWDGRPLPW